MPKNQNVSLSVIKRLPRYHRFLGDLLRGGVSRISSKELAAIMNLTASQIRQDLNCFGGFGQQGYGYNVEALYGEIGNILGLGLGFKAIQIGAGNLGKAVASHMEFEAQGFSLCAVFDENAEIAGTTIRDLTVRHTDELLAFCKEEKPTVAILCIPKEPAKALVPKLVEAGVKAFWNFSNYDIHLEGQPLAVENVHLSDSLMTLCYQVKELTTGGAPVSLEPLN